MPNLYPVLGAGHWRRGEEGWEQAGAAEAEAPSRGETGLASAIDPLSSSSRSGPGELFRSQPASGAHEVIVNTPAHEVSLAALPAEELAIAVEAWRERMRAHATASYLHLIVNEGPDAGASLEHTHAQLYALEFVPTALARERERATAYHERTMGSHLLSDVAVEEIRRRERLVAVDDDALLVCPWASRSPFELRILPREPGPRFEESTAGAAMLATALRALAAVFGAAPQMNLWVRTAPRGADEFCWHIDILPRLTTRAGFELGLGVEINTYPPERATADLRAAIEAA